MVPSVLIQPQPQLVDIERIQQQATPYEISVWQHRGATRDANGLWRSHEGHMIAPTPLLTRGEVIRKIKRQGYWLPYLQAMVDEYLSECEVCAQNNVRKGISAPIGHIPVPEGPFKHLVMDYADTIRTVRGKIYLLVIIDRFSRWWKQFHQQIKEPRQ